VQKDTIYSKAAQRYFSYIIKIIINFEKKSQTSTIILRGGAEQFIQEAERSLNDAIMIVRRAMKANKIVAGLKQILEIKKNLNFFFQKNRRWSH